jgi:hypothetical protein
MCPLCGVERGCEGVWQGRGEGVGWRLGGVLCGSVKVCLAAGASLAKWQRSDWFATTALAVSAVSLIYVHYQVQLSRHQAQLHLEPELKTYFDAPAEKNPVFVVANEGDIPAASVSVAVNMYVYDKNEKKVVTAASLGRIFSPGAIYRAELLPSEHESLELTGVETQPHLIVVYEFHVRYFRQTDMREFARNEYFFVEGGVPRQHADFMKNDHYLRIMAEAQRVQMPEQEWDQGALRRHIDATKQPD